MLVFWTPLMLIGWLGLSQSSRTSTSCQELGFLPCLVLTLDYLPRCSQKPWLPIYVSPLFVKVRRPDVLGKISCAAVLLHVEKFRQLKAHSKWPKCLVMLVNFENLFSYIWPNFWLFQTKEAFFLGPRPIPLVGALQADTRLVLPPSGPPDPKSSFLGVSNHTRT